ncbi:hypothetical protein Tco_0443946 [Tanacetum coccineum]
MVCVFKHISRGFGVGGRLVSAKKDGSAMAVTGISTREVASALCPNIASTPDLPELGSHDCLQFPGLLKPGAV